jgi:hypothetical protein
MKSNYINPQVRKKIFGIKLYRILVPEKARTVFVFVSPSYPERQRCPKPVTKRKRNPNKFDRNLSSTSPLLLHTIP